MSYPPSPHAPQLDLGVISDIASHQITHGEHEAAMHLLELIAALQPLTADQQHALCQCYYALGRMDDLERALTALWLISRTRKAQRLRAIALKLRGQFAAALHLFRATLAPATLAPPAALAPTILAPATLAHSTGLRT